MLNRLQNRKKVIVFLLLTVIVFADFLAVSTNSISRIMFALNSRKNIKQSQLFVIESGNYPMGFRWIEENKEFAVDNEYFDITKIETSGSQIHIYAVSDKKEDLLNKAVAGNSSTRKKVELKNHSFNFLKYVHTVAGKKIEEFTTIKYYDQKLTLISECRKVFSPPPEFFS